jgi:hypothetical protein
MHLNDGMRSDVTMFYIFYCLKIMSHCGNTKWQENPYLINNANLARNKNITNT